MKKFSSLFIENKTRVKLRGNDKDWVLVTNIDPTRNWVELKGYVGSFQSKLISKFTNKS